MRWALVFAVQAPVNHYGYFEDVHDHIKAVWCTRHGLARAVQSRLRSHAHKQEPWGKAANTHVENHELFGRLKAKEKFKKYLMRAPSMTMKLGGGGGMFGQWLRCSPIPHPDAYVRSYGYRIHRIFLVEIQYKRYITANLKKKIM